MGNSYEEIFDVLESGSKVEKIKKIESLVNSKDPKIINKIISKLDDSEIEVRGEAFSSLVLNENNISELLEANLISKIKNIRGFTALILANRRDSKAISSIVPLTKDSSSLVRACALGALGFLNAQEASKEIHSCFLDTNLEVKKSALKAALDIGDKILPQEIKEIDTEKDPELQKLLVQVKES